jgi:hypothetical protein
MSSIAEYLEMAQDAGFQALSSHDWSSRVTAPIQGLFQCLSALGNMPWGRRFLEWRNPLYRSFSDDDWQSLACAFRAHEYIRRFSKYVAFLFEKR